MKSIYNNVDEMCGSPRASLLQKGEKESSSSTGSGSGSAPVRREELLEIINIATQAKGKADNAMREVMAMKEKLEKVLQQATVPRREMEMDRNDNTSLLENPREDFSNSRDNNEDTAIALHNYRVETGLSEDTYVLMMTKTLFSKSWCFGFLICVVQVTILSMILHQQFQSSIGTTIFDIPFKVTHDVRASQFLAIFISILISHDILMPIKDLTILWVSNPEWSKVLDDIGDSSYRSLKNMQNEALSRPIDRKICWMLQILLPSVLKFVQGMLVLLITFVIVIQADDTIELFKDFAAMQVISELDDVAFQLASHGYFGSKLKRDSNASKEIKVNDRAILIFGLPLRPLIFSVLLILSISVFLGVVVAAQENLSLFEKKYPSCGIKDRAIIANITNGNCNGGTVNSFECGFDGGDCIYFNLAYPRCKSLRAYEVGDGVCQDAHNVEECGYDGGDCCQIHHEDPYLGDKQCHGGFYNTKACHNDESDCDTFNSNFPSCPEVHNFFFKSDGTQVILGDGICEFIEEYMTEECNYENGDCTGCLVQNPEKVGDGICDGGQWNTEGCLWDGGDCDACNAMNNVLSTKLGDGICNFGQYNTEECNFDGNDCDRCNSFVGINNTNFVGNGVCDGGHFNTEECSWDNGDCSCINDALEGNCDLKPDQMLNDCRAACKVIPLLLKTSRTVRLQSTTKSSIICLTATDDDEFANLVFKNCTNGNFNQKFFMKKNNRLSGEIHSSTDTGSKYCLKMVHPNALEQSYSVFMHSDCVDVWEVLQSGALKNAAYEKCLGWHSNSSRVVGVECDSDNVEYWFAIDSQYELFNLHFRTDSSDEYAPSSGPFAIDGYGSLPSQCHKDINAECDIQIYGMDTLTVQASTEDAWRFIITGDIYFVDNPLSIALGTDEYDSQKTFTLKTYDSDECFNVNFKTLVPSLNNTGNFEVDGYGHIPSKCYSNIGSECDITVCGRRTLVLRAFTVDEWQFEISGDIGSLLDYKTTPGGTHKIKATMDTDEYDYIKVYELIPRSSCVSRAVTDDECETNSTYMLEHCGTTCNLIDLYKGRQIQLRGSRNASKCLTSTGSYDEARLFYDTCSDNNLNQAFIFKVLKSNLFSSFGRIYSANYESCLEMHSTQNDQILMHSFCSDTYEITKNGALKNIEKGKCLGFDGVDGTMVTPVDCDSEDTEIWEANISIFANLQDSTSLMTRGLCADLEDWHKSTDGMKVRLAACDPSAGSQQWNYDSSGRLVNSYTNKCLETGAEGNLFDKAYISSCHNGTHQQWSKEGDQYLNRAYPKYLGVTSCGDTPGSKWLELRNSAESEKCNTTQSWNQKWMHLKTKGLCAQVFAQNEIRLVPCNPHEHIQQWNYDNLSRLVNRALNVCLDAGFTNNLYERITVYECHDFPNQKWIKNTQYKFMNKLFPTKYIGVAFCGEVEEAGVLELRNLETDGNCNATQTWF